MRFGTHKIPGSLFAIARDKMLASPEFTPADIRGHVIATAESELAEISSSKINQGIIANRVVRRAITELKIAGEIAQAKRGRWICVPRQN